MKTTKKAKKSTITKKTVKKPLSKPKTNKAMATKAKKPVAKKITFTQHVIRFGRKKFLALSVLTSLFIVIALIAASSISGTMANNGSGNVLGLFKPAALTNFRVEKQDTASYRRDELRFSWKFRLRGITNDGYYLYCDKCNNGKPISYDVPRGWLKYSSPENYFYTYGGWPANTHLTFRISAYKVSRKGVISESNISNSASVTTNPLPSTFPVGDTPPTITNPGTIKSAKWVNITRVAANVRDGQVKFYSTHTQDRFIFWCEDKNKKRIDGSFINIPNTLQPKDKNGDRYRLSNNRYPTSTANRFCYISGVRDEAGGLSSYTPTIEVTY